MTDPVKSEHIVPRTRDFSRRLNATSLRHVGLAALVASSLIACGGGDDPVEHDDDDSSFVSVSVAASGSGGNGATPTTTGNTGGTDNHGCNPGDGGQGGEDVDPVDTPPKMWPAKGLTITQITLNQGIRHTLMRGDEAANDDTPIIADRPGIVRVFYKQFAKHNANEVTARLTIGEAVIEKTLSHGSVSSDGDLNSTINFDVPASLIQKGMSYSVELLHPAGGEWGADVNGASFPVEAQQPVAVDSTGEGLKIVFVPIRYGADSSNRMPDLSDEQLALHREAVMDVYPVRDVEITVRAQALQWDSPIDAKGDGWSRLLTAVADLRTADHAANDTYYYGVFNPNTSFGSYCSGGCVAGLGFVSPAMNSWSRAAIGLGFPGKQLAETFAHELGHNHGRVHSPCGGPKNPDPNFPDANGSIGNWGFDISDGTLHSPSTSRDFMSYCDPAWVSKFTYEGLFDRAQLLNNVLLSATPSAEPVAYDRVIVGEDGKAEWTKELTLSTPPHGELRDVDVTSEAGSRQETATFVPFDHIDGGVLFVPRPTRGNADGRARALKFEAAGQMRQLKR